MDLLVGLGNPGRSYANTRHNAGFLVMDHMAERLRLSFRAGKGEYEVAEGKYDDRRVWLMKPTTFMNHSGVAVREFAQFYKIPVRHILVACDDVALPLGRMRIRPSGSDGGQNGLKSVLYQLNTDQFPRLRVGVGNEDMGRFDLADFVLSAFADEEWPVVRKVVETAADALLCYLEEGMDKAMNRYNRVMLDNPNA